MLGPRIQFPSSDGAVCTGRVTSEMAAHIYRGEGSTVQPTYHTVFSHLSRPPTMDATSSKRQKRQDNALSLLNAAIEAMNLAKEVSSATPAKAIFGSVGILLTMIMVRFILFSNDTFQVHVLSGLDGQ